MLYQRHICCSAAALLVSNIPMFNNKWFIYTGDDVIVDLLKKLIELDKKCINYLKINRPMKDDKKSANNLRCCDSLLHM